MIRWRIHNLLLLVEAELIAWKAAYQIIMREMWRR
jgi:hypothetical protein